MIDFNDFNENVSDEMLAAYIDGNATPSEASLIELSVGSNDLLSESLDLTKDAITFGNSHDWDIHKGDLGFWELGLPPVISESELSLAADISQNSFTCGEQNELLNADENSIFPSFGDSFLDSTGSNDIDADLDTFDMDNELEDLLDY